MYLRRRSREKLLVQPQNTYFARDWRFSRADFVETLDWNAG